MIGRESRIRAAAALVAFACALVPGEGLRAQSGARADEETALDADPVIADAAIARLRARGPAGLAALLDAHPRELASLDAEDAAHERLRRAIDRVAGQRDAHASRLYFFTDLDAATAEARRRGVPVLSLQLLGRLDEELSCANSRYFRTILYSDPAIAGVMRERFVLHWSSERPAPRITIDMGDGRTMVRTITGNSIHYVLDASGRVVDALPGLYAPERFHELLDRAAGWASECGARDDDAFRACLAPKWQGARRELEQAWNALRRAEPELPTWAALMPAPEARSPTARNAMAQTMSKAFVERPMLDAIARRPTPRVVDGIDWVSLVRREPPLLAEPTLALLRLKTGRADVRALAGQLALNAAADGLRNDSVMHRQILEWLEADASPARRATLNARVYAEIFLTPASDPWLGLRSDEAWDAIETIR